MWLRRKLTLGLVLLFSIIFALVIYGSLEIQRLATDAKAIVKDNYESLVYCKGMFLALDDMKTALTDKFIDSGAGHLPQPDAQLFENGKAVFEVNLTKEQGNITEVHEQDYVDELANAYRSFLSRGVSMGQSRGRSVTDYRDVLSAYLGARQAIARIDDVNMEAIQRKNVAAIADSNKMIISFAIVGSICLILAFFYFWYFPFYVSNSLSYLTEKMKALLKNMGISPDTQTKDEMFVMLNAINLLENRLQKAADKPKRKRAVEA
jgi:two-component system, NtrC family, sensor histidine kinase KinB